MSQNEMNLVWLDLEMTGLDPEHDRIIEIATVITDSNLNTLAEGPVIAIHQSDALLDGMDEWCTKQHGKSGLTERVKQSTVSEADAEAQSLAFIQEWVPQNASPMCGNSIYQDRRFLAKYMSAFNDHFHYRNLDVSTLKILAQRWRPEIADGVNKESEHLALADVYDSINELKHYRDTWLK
ncbi:MAG: oligoribonuclease [Coxiella sp. (in: Bacteria)]|nr:MAG: oligoribonuclease [Coxiella sp. (in: g-proteobacteria)]